MAMFVSILLSAAVHEYFIALSLRFVSPTLIIQFAGLGGKMFYSPKSYTAIRTMFSLSCACL